MHTTLLFTSACFQHVGFTACRQWLVSVFPSDMIQLVLGPDRIALVRKIDLVACQRHSLISLPAQKARNGETKAKKKGVQP